MNTEFQQEPRTASDSGSSLQRIVRRNHVFHLNKNACPYCGGKLTATVNGWHKEDDGWLADDLQLDCENDDETHEDHCYMPCENWLPVEQRILKWMNAHYRWALDDASNDQELSHATGGSQKPKDRSA